MVREAHRPSREYGLRTRLAESAAFRSPHLTGHTGLESLSQCAVKVPRTVSAGERAWLKDIIAKYGDDFEKAARDRRLNPWQRTAAEIKRSCVPFLLVVYARHRLMNSAGSRRLEGSRSCLRTLEVVTRDLARSSPVV